MNMLLAFSPFAAFVVIERLTGVVYGLAAGALIAAILLVRDAISAGRTVKLLEIGTTLLFTGLTLYAIATQAQWSVAAVRLRVDAGLTLVVLASIALRQPFTLEYARESVSRARWDSPDFLRVNYVISSVWAAAFYTLAFADAVMEYLPAVPHSAGIALTVIALLLAMKFSRWYPQAAARRL